MDIAVKMLNKKSSERETVRFLQEAAIMGQFKHPNIVRLHGVVTVGNPVSVTAIYMWLEIYKFREVTRRKKNTEWLHTRSDIKAYFFVL